MFRFVWRSQLPPHQLCYGLRGPCKFPHTEHRERAQTQQHTSREPTSCARVLSFRFVSVSHVFLESRVDRTKKFYQLSRSTFNRKHRELRYCVHILNAWVIPSPVKCNHPTPCPLSVSASEKCAHSKCFWIWYFEYVVLSYLRSKIKNKSQHSQTCGNTCFVPSVVFKKSVLFVYIYEYFIYRFWFNCVCMGMCCSSQKFEWSTDIQPPFSHA